MRLSFNAIFGAALLFSSQANAAVLIEIIETGGNVQATLSGNINLSALGVKVGNSTGFNAIRPSGGNISFTGNNSGYYNLNESTWTPFGGGATMPWDSSSGDAWHMFADPVLGLPIGYISQAPLSATATKNNSSFAVMGLTPGVYVTTLANGEISDTVTINVGQLVPVIINDEIALNGIRGKSFTRTPDTTYPTESTAGVYSFTATFCGAGMSNFASLLSSTKAISSHASLVSRDTPVETGTGGIGSEQLFQTTGDYADGILQWNECVDVTYNLGLTQKKRFSFRVDVWGTSVAAPQQ